MVSCPRSRCKPEKCEAGQQNQPATENTGPKTRANASRGKEGAQHRETPHARRGSDGRRNLTTNGYEPHDHNGESPRKTGQRPEQQYIFLALRRVQNTLFDTI